MIVQDLSGPARAAAAPAGRGRLDDAVARFQRSGQLDGEAFAAAGPAETAAALRTLPPAQRGALEGALIAEGLGGLLKGVGGAVDDTVGVVEDTADTVADPAIETRSERTVSSFQAAVHDEWWTQARGQAQMDLILAARDKLDRPAAALANLTRTEESSPAPEAKV